MSMYRIEGPEDGGVPPGHPNFGLVLALFCVTIFVTIGVACLFLPIFLGNKTPVNPDYHPTSQIVMPVTTWDA